MASASAPSLSWGQAGRWALCGVLTGLGWLPFGCQRPEPSAQPVLAPSAKPAEPVEPVLGPDKSSFFPAQTQLLAGVTSRQLLADQECAECHPQIAAEWRQSAHAFSSFNNPVYRFAVDRLRATKGRQPSRMCAGCHDPALLVDGAMDLPVELTDARASAGIGCQLCHGVRQVSMQGNGSYTLGRPELPRPDLNDEHSVRRHRRAMRQPVLHQPELCGSCHRSFLGPETGNAYHLKAMDDFGPWARSAYAGTRTRQIDPGVELQTCQQCHMPKRRSLAGVQQGQLTASHQFVGGHTWLAQMLGDKPLLSATQAQLRSGVRLQIARVTQAADAAFVRDDEVELLKPTPGSRLQVEVVLKNTGVGHRFPGGTRDIQNTWLELEVWVGQQLLASSLQSHTLWTALGDEQGSPLKQHETHEFAAKLYDNTLPPRDAALVRYGIPLPDSLAAGELTLVARLKHKSRTDQLQRAACSAQHAAAAERGHTAASEGGLDACVEQPVTLLAEQSVSLNFSSKPKRWAPEAKDLYDYSLAALKELPEKVHQLGPLLQPALAQTGPQQASFLVLAARLNTSQARTADALEQLSAAQRLAPTHPATSRLRAEAYAAVWRWPDAARWYGAAARENPRDDLGWSLFAQAAASAGDHTTALQAAEHALMLQPLAEAPLRTRAIALERMGGDAARAREATERYLRFRVADETPHILARCKDRSAWCSQEQLPLHTHELTINPARTPAPNAEFGYSDDSDQASFPQ